MGAAHREEVIKSLLGTLHETVPYYDQSEAVLNRSYAPGKWTAREILVHLSDCEAVLLDRLRRLASEEKPVLMAFDENRWAAELFYKRRDLQISRLQYESARRCVLELARALAPEVDSRSGTHSESGTRTFGQVLAHTASHNAHHLGQLRAIAAGGTWTKQLSKL